MACLGRGYPTAAMRLYRPVGVKELELIQAAAWRAFPPRLFHQPIFYPVLSRTYAETIARRWNTDDVNSGFAGFVTTFEVDDAFVARYPVQVVGGRDDRELWVPAEELDDFNRHLVGVIDVLASFYGECFAGDVDAVTRLPAGILPPHPLTEE